MNLLFSFLLAAELVLPVSEVREVADHRAKSYPGRVVAIQRVDVIPQVSGEILEVCFKDGAQIKEGEVLYRIDPVKYEAAVKNAESKLTEMKANVKYAELSYERHKNLMETRAVSMRLTTRFRSATARARLTQRRRPSLLRRRTISPTARSSRRSRASSARRVRRRAITSTRGPRRW